MEISLAIKPLSLNNCYAGRRHDTKAKKEYDRALRWMLPRKPVPGRFYAVTMRFYLRRCFGGDLDNLCKVLMDNLVDVGIISNDRRVVAIHLYKFVASQDRIVITVDGFDTHAQGVTP